MRFFLNVTKVLLLCILAIHIKPVSAAPLFIDASVDLTKLKIADKNAIGDATTNSSAPVQAAIDYLAKNPEGGSLIFGPGVYRVGAIIVKPGVKIVGADREKTIFRAANRGVLFDMRGGELHNFTAYGTPDEASSGDNWKVGTRGQGIGGSAWSSYVIRVGLSPTEIAKDVVISNVTAMECRFDPLYTRGSENLKVLNCSFDRAGRNVVSLVGNDNNFLISGCYIGSLWGLYHSDIEPNHGQFVRNGMILNCVFDGSNAGYLGTRTSSALFIFSGAGQKDNTNIAIVGCTFNKIRIRVRGIFPDIQYLYNPQIEGFYRASSNPTGEYRDATVRGNYFGTPGSPKSNITGGITFTGKTIFEDNIPAAANKTKITAESNNGDWVEDAFVEEPAQKK